MQKALTVAVFQGIYLLPYKGRQRRNLWVGKGVKPSLLAALGVTSELWL